ncbi:hypothetical protein K474DRAFT_740164 [Panus rudis PR-1116 ss-1]|nr:hypothetical protein K474DRAFT_740164 [Panus rudis PR-1116 ss-1]
MGFEGLPPELHSTLVKYLATKDLLALSRVSKRLHDVASSHLYAHIKITNSQQAFSCCNTLANSQYDYASHVRTFSVDDFPPWNYTEWHKRCFREWLIKGVHRMTNLMHFRCMLSGSFAQDMCAVLKERKTLVSLAISIPHYDPWVHDSLPPWSEDVLRPYFPLLTSFAFHYTNSRPPICPIYEKFLIHMIQAHHKHLRVLRLPEWLPLEYGYKLIPTHLKFDNLRSLTIQASALHYSFCEQMKNVTHLTYPKHEPSMDDRHIPSNAFPNLTHFSGSCRCVKDILSRNRPVRFLQFDGAIFDMEDADIFMEGSQPTWRDVFAAIKRFPESQGPVREFRFYIRSLRIAMLPKAINYLTSLHSITICLRSDIKDLDYLPKLGRKFFRDMPVLHTFLLSDEPFFVYRGKRFSIAEDIPKQRSILELWESYCPTLRRVSFTAAFVWDKLVVGNVDRDAGCENGVGGGDDEEGVRAGNGNGKAAKRRSNWVRSVGPRRKKMGFEEFEEY